MQAYASAQATSVGSESQRSTRPKLVQGATLTGIAGATGWANGAESSSSILASLVLDGLDDDDLAVLARRLLPHLKQPADADERGPLAYTVASLGMELGCRRRPCGARSPVGNCRRSSVGRVGSSRQTRSAPGPRHRSSGGRLATPGSPQLRRLQDLRCAPSSAAAQAGEAHDERREGQAHRRGSRMASSMAPARAQSCPDVQ
jgi:hypothetical protein